MMGLIKFFKFTIFCLLYQAWGENDVSGVGVEITNLRNASLDHRS